MATPSHFSACDQILQGLNGVLGERFAINHTTVQFEHVGCAVSESGCVIPAGHAICPTGGHLDPSAQSGLAPDIMPMTVEEGIADGIDEHPVTIALAARGEARRKARGDDPGRADRHLLW